MLAAVAIDARAVNSGRLVLPTLSASAGKIERTHGKKSRTLPFWHAVDTGRENVKFTTGFRACIGRCVVIYLSRELQQSIYYTMYHRNFFRHFASFFRFVSKIGSGSSKPTSRSQSPMLSTPGKLATVAANTTTEIAPPKVENPDNGCIFDKTVPQADLDKNVIHND